MKDITILHFSSFYFLCILKTQVDIFERFDHDLNNWTITLHNISIRAFLIFTDNLSRISKKKYIFPRNFVLIVDKFVRIVDKLVRDKSYNIIQEHSIITLILHIIPNDITLLHCLQHHHKLKYSKILKFHTEIFFCRR